MSRRLIPVAAPGLFALFGFINFADNIRKPGGFLEYDVYEDHAENGDGDHHVNDA
jgi:hypothetical protein